MKIANIVFEKELVNHTKVDYVNYINEPIEYEKLDQSIPTLYVGWVFMKSCNPNNEIIKNANILEHRIISNQLYWECSFEESKPSHIKGVDNFVNLAPQFYFNPKYTYINLDPVFFQITSVDELLDVLPKKINSVYQYKDEMLYILYDNKITGVNLKMYEYFKFSTTDIINRVKGRSEKFIDDLNGDTYISYYKIFPNFSNLKRYLIVILSK